MVESIKVNDWNEEILEFLESKKSSNLKIKFWLRRRNTNERLDNG